MTDTNRDEKVMFTRHFDNEHQFSEWFKENFSQFGFERIIKINTKRAGSPDFIMQKNGKELGIELELFSSDFLKHKHDQTKVSAVYCIVKDIELPIPVVELTSFTCGKPISTLPISKRLKLSLDSARAKMAQKQNKPISWEEFLTQMHNTYLHYVFNR